MKILRNIYLTKWFFALFVQVIILYVIAFSLPWIEFIANVVLASLIGITMIDILLVFSNSKPITVERKAKQRLNLGDANTIELKVINETGQPLNFTLIEGYPVEMQDRSTVLSGTLSSHSWKEFSYL
ncbi:MAG: hypothetical protein ACKVJC_11140, partial [Flavobacteriales bacterium]